MLVSKDSRGKTLQVFADAQVEQVPLSAWMLYEEGICGAVEVVVAFDGRLHEDVGWACWLYVRLC